MNPFSHTVVRFPVDCPFSFSLAAAICKVAQPSMENAPKNQQECRIFFRVLTKTTTMAVIEEKLWTLVTFFYLLIVHGPKWMHQFVKTEVHCGGKFITVL